MTEYTLDLGELNESEWYLVRLLTKYKNNRHWDYVTSHWIVSENLNSGRKSKIVIDTLVERGFLVWYPQMSYGKPTKKCFALGGYLQIMKELEG